MQLAIFSKTFERSSLQDTLDAVVEHGFAAVQFDLVCAGLESMPAVIPDDLADEIRRAHAARGVVMSAVSGTFNMIHPDVGQRADGLERLKVIIASARRLGTSVVTLCTGTRDPHNMWRRHPDNDTPAAWRDLLVTLGDALRMAEEHDIILAFEPELANVVSSARKGRQLLDELRSKHLKVVMDGANLVPHNAISRMPEFLDEGFALLGDDIVIAHAKDLTENGFVAAGKGALDYDRYLRLLKQARLTGPLILHGLREEEVDDCRRFLQAMVASD